MKVNIGKIDGVEIVKRTTHSDDRGDLTEIYRTDEHYHEDMVNKYVEYGNSKPEQINQVYIVKNPVRDTIRAFHKHEHLWDFFTIIHGRAKFILVDDRKDSPTYLNKMIIIADAANVKMIVVPPGVHHGWQSLIDDTILLSIASHTYYREKPDEARVPYTEYDNWKIEFK
ncbi:MAG: hypothetical protein GY863_00385 [bacterium]|nr:hypothetical protein [bacterium]